MVRVQETVFGPAGLATAIIRGGSLVHHRDLDCSTGISLDARDMASPHMESQFDSIGCPRNNQRRSITDLGSSCLVERAVDFYRGHPDWYECGSESVCSQTHDECLCSSGVVWLCSRTPWTGHAGAAS